jgi:hypothetical protein
LGFELKKAVADDREARIIDGSATKVAQCVRLRQQRFVGRATVPLAQQMDSFHRVTLQELLPLGRLPDPGATVAKCGVPDEPFGALAPRDRRCNRYNSRAPARNRNVKLWHNGCVSAIEFKTFAPLSGRRAHHFPAPHSDA